MSASRPVPPLVACIESDADTAALIRQVLDDEGFLTLTHTCGIGAGVQPLITFLTDFQPQVVMYAVDPPYAEGWERFQRVRDALPFCAWVITTTDRRTLEVLAGANGSVPIVAKPFDLEGLVAAVRGQMSTPVAA